jgi:CspA family cold shock protein
MDADMLGLPADQFLICQHCQISFVWTGWEQVRDARQPDLCPGCRHLLANAPRWGVVKWFDARKGFGFVTTADGADIYVRRKDLRRGRSLRAGQWVSFRVGEGRNGARATDVIAHRRWGRSD